MTEPRYHIAIAGFQHETNSFSPDPTELNDFLRRGSWPRLTTGPELFEVFDGLNIPFSGFAKAANASQTVELTPVVWAGAEPYGLVTSEAFEHITNIICEGVKAANNLDAVYLDLHGAMVTDNYEDGEAEVVRRVREIIGDDIPLVISLDFHANISPPLAEITDAITIYRTYPHIDMAQTGARAFDLLKEMLDRDTRPAKAFCQIPYLIPLSSQHTGSPPVRELFGQLEALSVRYDCSLDFACGFPPSDITHCGPSIVAYGWDSESVAEMCNAFEQDVRTAEGQFPDNILSAKQAVQQAIASSSGGGKPVVIADVQDNPGAGGSADTTQLLHELVAQGATGAVMAALWDAEVAEQAHEAGVNKTINAQLGGKSGPDGEAPLGAEFLVEALGDGNVQCFGAMMGGMKLDVGPMALLRVVDDASEVRVVVTSHRVQCLDQAIIRVMGVDLSQQSIIALKSTVHFRADFEPIASDVLVAACPGVHPCELDVVNYVNLRDGVRLGPNGPAHTKRVSGEPT